MTTGNRIFFFKLSKVNELKAFFTRAVEDLRRSLDSYDKTTNMKNTLKFQMTSISSKEKVVSLILKVLRYRR